MYSKIKGFVGNVPLRLIATVLLAILIPSLLVTGLGLLAVFQADHFVHGHVTGPFKRELKALDEKVDREWQRLLEGYADRLLDADERGAYLARFREEPHVRDLLIEDGLGLHLVPRVPYPPLWLDLEPAELLEARRLEAADRGSAALDEYVRLAREHGDDAVVVEALLGAARASFQLDDSYQAVRYLEEALGRYGDTLDATGILRKLPLLCRKLEIEHQEGLADAGLTARRLAAALRRESNWLEDEVLEFFQQRLSQVAEEEALAASLASGPVESVASLITEDMVKQLEPWFASRSRESGVRVDGGEEMVFVSFPSSNREVQVHLLLERSRFLEDVYLFAEDLGIARESLLFVGPHGELLEERSPSRAEREVVATRAMPRPFGGLEMRYVPPPNTLPPGFRSFDFITLATFVWAIIVLVLTVIVGVFVTLRSVLKEMKTARLKSDFVSFISHELKTPLAAIRMFTETLQDGRLKDETERKMCIEMIDRESDRLTKLIEKVLEYSRIERRQKAFHFTSCDMEEIVREAVELFHTENKDHPREVEINSVQRISKIMLDRESMVELVLNLLSNANKYSASDRKIVINLRESVDEISVDVVDLGIGIPKRDQKRIFEKFFRSQDYLTREVEGMGLGLALARYIAKVHNGDIRVTSHVNSGSTFSLNLKKTHVFAE